ncbi:hypothetical protein MTBBW1_1430030 [Desulfamplus magnetovallimortis]|uniref:Uncharacterized protein n=1 Tax=Desulfamplus magnetovallimortis TaxID=1246637 RepID=A0A1W1H8F2_9BACT|nr:type 4a pilus biogenesis protein PilO [Desulfamplus magnetovallimortis]SLM28658.1 hypothetical protein MTBBW1_1430030 [Desulfamplus magnetovallimortis]
MKPDLFKRLILFCLVLFVALLFFRYTVIEKQGREIDSLISDYSKIRERGNSNDNLYLSYESARHQLDSVRLALPQFHEFPYVISDINDLLEKNNLVSSGMIFKPVLTDKLDLWKFASSLSVEGSYQNLKSFIAGFQAMPGINTISRVVFNKEKKESGSITLEVDIAVYCRKD